MPNWCMNDVYISGPKEKITDLYYAAMDRGGLLETMVPIGEWDYNLAVENWGVKWDVDPENLELEVEGDIAYISGTVDSAWAPPIKAFESFLEKNPECVAELKYHEPGMEFIGVFADGNDSCYEYSSEELDSLDDIPGDLLEHFNLEEDLRLNLEIESDWEEED